MQDKPRSRLDIREFSGLFTSADPYDLPPGSSQNQVNVAVINEGALTVRQGYQTVSFEEDV